MMSYGKAREEVGREWNGSEHVYSERVRLTRVLWLSCTKYEWKIEKRNREMGREWYRKWA